MSNSRERGLLTSLCPVRPPCPRASCLATALSGACDLAVLCLLILVFKQHLPKESPAVAPWFHVYPVVLVYIDFIFCYLDRVSDSALSLNLPEYWSNPCKASMAGLASMNVHFHQFPGDMDAANPRTPLSGWLVYQGYPIHGLRASCSPEWLWMWPNTKL